MNTTETIAKLTDKGREAMTTIGRRQVSFFDEGIVESSGSWGSELSGDLGLKGSGVLNRLRDLGLFTTTPASEDDSSDWWALTALGAAVANELAGENAPQDEEVPAADNQASERPMTRKECVAALKAAGYEGPTSYLMPKLRAIVAEHTA